MTKQENVLYQATVDNHATWSFQLILKNSSEPNSQIRSHRREWVEIIGSQTKNLQHSITTYENHQLHARIPRFSIRPGGAMVTIKESRKTKTPYYYVLIVEHIVKPASKLEENGNSERLDEVGE